MNNIDQHIQKDVDILNDPTISSQSRRHIEEELEALEAYKTNHPEDSHDPSPLELMVSMIQVKMNSLSVLFANA
jgi:hypothetical protein